MNTICISKLILRGSLISTRIENELNWSFNIVYNCSDNGIDIPLTPDLLKSNLFIGTNITIKFKNEYYEYIIHGPITKIELCGSPYIRVRSSNISENKNNRLFQRHDVYLPAILSFHNNNGCYCKVSNISLGGIAFLLNREIPNGTECEAYIFLNEYYTIYCKGEILRCSTQNSFIEFSMRFTFMDEENSNCLYSYLYSIDNSYDSLRSKYLIDSVVS